MPAQEILKLRKEQLLGGSREGLQPWDEPVPPRNAALPMNHGCVGAEEGIPRTPGLTGEGKGPSSENSKNLQTRVLNTHTALTTFQAQNKTQPTQTRYYFPSSQTNAQAIKIPTRG